MVLGEEPALDRAVVDVGQYSVLDTNAAKRRLCQPTLGWYNDSVQRCGPSTLAVSRAEGVIAIPSVTQAVALLLLHRLYRCLRRKWPCVPVLRRLERTIVEPYAYWAVIEWGTRSAWYMSVVLERVHLSMMGLAPTADRRVFEQHSLSMRTSNNLLACWNEHSIVHARLHLQFEYPLA